MTSSGSGTYPRRSSLVQTTSPSTAISKMPPASSTYSASMPKESLMRAARPAALGR
jgi:hypothetical protein